jgi:hypothetical protein
MGDAGSGKPGIESGCGGLGARSGRVADPAEASPSGLPAGSPALVAGAGPRDPDAEPSDGQTTGAL